MQSIEQKRFNQKILVSDLKPVSKKISEKITKNGCFQVWKVKRFYLSLSHIPKLLLICFFKLEVFLNLEVKKLSTSPLVIN